MTTSDKHIFELKILGGNNEFGRNSVALRQDDFWFIIDCGMEFPKHDLWDLERIVTDTTRIFPEELDFKGYFITHAHEDHIGGLLHSLSKRPGKIYTSRYTAEVIKFKLEEYNQNLLHKTEFIILKPSQKINIDENFSVLPLEVIHSIPNSMAFLFYLPSGKIFHTGDYKFPKDPFEIKDFELWKQELQNKVFLMLGDSTGILTEGNAPEEKDVFKALTKHIKNIKGRVFITQFSSNTDRIHTIYKTAEENGRKVALFGRSMLFYTDIARQLGLYSFDNNIFVPYDQINKYDKSEQIIVISGSQGESFSSLNRLSFNHIKGFTLTEDDAVFFSSRAIPGREQQITDMVDRIVSYGAKVLDHYAYDDLHASGHAYAEGIKRMIKFVNPKVYVPIHGNFRNIKKAAETAEKIGISEVLTLHDGNSAIYEDNLWIIDEFELKINFLDGEKLNTVDRLHFKQRTDMASRGFISVYIVTDQHFTPLILPEIQIFGLGNQEFINKYTPLISSEILKILPIEKHSACKEEIREKIRVEVMRFFKRNYGKKPLVNIVIHQIDPCKD